MIFNFVLIATWSHVYSCIMSTYFFCCLFMSSSIYKTINYAFFMWYIANKQIRIFGHSKGVQYYRSQFLHTMFAADCSSFDSAKRAKQSAQCCTWESVVLLWLAIIQRCSHLSLLLHLLFPPYSSLCEGLETISPWMTWHKHGVNITQT